MRWAPETKRGRALATVDGMGRFMGYASLFGRVDLSGDLVMPGAFARSLRRRSAGEIRMLFEHDPNAAIGLWDRLEEDKRGLWVEGHLVRSPRAARIGEAMQSGRLDGLSIGFRTVSASEDRSARVRQLTEIDLWEVSVVRSPMLPEARTRAPSAPAASWGLHPGQLRADDMRA